MENIINEMRELLKTLTDIGEDAEYKRVRINCLSELSDSIDQIEEMVCG